MFMGLPDDIQSLFTDPKTNALLTDPSTDGRTDGPTDV